MQFATIIRAKDFTRFGQRHNGLWTRQAMECVVDALAGMPVVVTVDSQTGHSEVGVTLERVAPYGFSGQFGVVVKRTLPDGTEQRTNFALMSVGDTIVPLGETPTSKGPKWVAVDLWRERGYMSSDYHQR